MFKIFSFILLHCKSFFFGEKFSVCSPERKLRLVACLCVARRQAATCRFMLYVVCFIGIPNIINAETAKTNFAAVPDTISYNLSLPGDCPSNAILEKNKEWVEHREAWNKRLDSILAAHLKLPLAPVNGSVYLNHVAVKVDRGMGVLPWQEIVWSISRTNQANYYGKNNNCYVVGTVAYYVELKNKNGWPPIVEILNKPETEKECLVKGDFGLIELRWYDPVEKKKHRWFNHRLALYLQWVMENTDSPVSLPRVINSLD